MRQRNRLRQDTHARWTSINPTLASGEVVWCSDRQDFKVGNGVNTYIQLPYLLKPVTENTPDFYHPDASVQPFYGPGPLTIKEALDRIGQALLTGTTPGSGDYASADYSSTDYKTT